MYLADYDESELLVMIVSGPLLFRLRDVDMVQTPITHVFYVFSSPKNGFLQISSQDMVFGGKQPEESGRASNVPHNDI